MVVFYIVYNHTSLSLIIETYLRFTMKEAKALTIVGWYRCAIASFLT